MKKGDLVELSFTAIAGGGIVEKTSEPALVFVGEGSVVKGLDAALLGSEAGESKKISLSAAEAFGERREELVRLVPLEQFRRQGIDPIVGMPVELDGTPARVQAVSGGRVRVDFNHELAGKTVEYEFKVENVFSAPGEKVSALSKRLLPGCEAKLEGERLEVSAPAGVRKDADYTVRKVRFVEQCLRFVEGVKKAEVREQYEAGKEMQEAPVQ